MWRYLNRGVSDVKQDQSKVDDKGTGQCKYNYLKKMSYPYTYVLCNTEKGMT